MLDFNLLSYKLDNFAFTSSIMKNDLGKFSRFRVKINFCICIAFGSTSSAYCLLKSIAIIF